MSIEIDQSGINSITEDFWVDHYKPIKNHLDPNAAFDGCLFATYGPELKRVRAAEPNKVWTLLEVESKQFIRAGWRRIDRLAYFITEVPWTDESLEVHWDLDQEVSIAEHQRKEQTRN